MTSIFAAAGAPDRPAYVMAQSGVTVSYGELEADSNRYAQFFRSLGLQPGDHIAMMFGPNEATLKAVWAARRSGLVYTIISPHLTPAETAYIIADCTARIVVTDAPCLEQVLTASKSLEQPVPVYAAGCGADGHADLRALIAAFPPVPVADESEGADMLYSSGTTGRPKGIIVGSGGMSAGSDALVQVFAGLWSFDADTVYLSTGPLYHSAPLRSCTTVFRLGGTAVVMEKFDAATALRLIETYRVTHSQWVPTMFVRLLRLTEADRAAFDLSSHRVAVHAAAPCPRGVKEQMMAWWGPIIYEYYGATESIGSSFINPQEWLAHPGSVGKPVNAVVHITDEHGNELPVGADGLIYFSDGPTFEYFNDPGKTDEAANARGWLSVGDIGHVDEDGYLYLTDRHTFMIISGGVNIYPQEVEDLLLGHPKVFDAAVIGVPHEEMGEQVRAVVTPVSLADAGDELARELIGYCRSNLAHYKCPKSVDFWPQLPRRDNGKLYKSSIRDYYRRQEAG
jgi:long-chain acyl-CoA synthetase